MGIRFCEIIEMKINNRIFRRENAWGWMVRVFVHCFEMVGIMTWVLYG